jgi:hypothetical protein
MPSTPGGRLAGGCGSAVSLLLVAGSPWDEALALSSGGFERVDSVASVEGRGPVDEVDEVDVGLGGGPGFEEDSDSDVESLEVGATWVGVGTDWLLEVMAPDVTDVVVDDVVVAASVPDSPGSLAHAATLRLASTSALARR